MKFEDITCFCIHPSTATLHEYLKNPYLGELFLLIDGLSCTQIILCFN